jgi:hypothetical protein
MICVGLFIYLCVIYTWQENTITCFWNVLKVLLGRKQGEVRGLVVYITKNIVIFNEI